MKRNKRIPKISVCMTMYNASSFLRECMDSVLKQTFSDFEFLIVDDGSRDNSVKIVKSYGDNRIRLIRNRHNYIESLNILLSEAKGEYIARMDADDVMLSERLSMQYNYMIKHPNLDVLSALVVGISDDFCVTNDDLSVRMLTKKDFLFSNPIVHPTTFIRRKSLDIYGLQYKSKYIYAEDYALWCDFAILGLHLGVMNKPVLKYRMSSGQVSQKYSKKVMQVGDIIKSDFSHKLCKMSNSNHRNITKWFSSNKMTAIIPFLNEGEEVVNTVKSLREKLEDKIDIIVINDQSTDEFPYKEILKPYDVHYIVNWKRRGVAASRDYGVSICKTPYFVLLDAHMRIYDSEWVLEACSALDKNERQILCMQTRQLWRDEQNKVVKIEGTSKVFGAYLTFEKGNLCPGIEWNYAESEVGKTHECIPAILGAGYVASKNYWMRLNGLVGLEQYGCDEAYISLKTWLEGGTCVLLKNHEFGHIYRDNAPYVINSSSYVYNYLLIAYTLFPYNMWLWVLASCQVSNPHETQKAYAKIRARKSMLQKLRDKYKDFTCVKFHKIWNMNKNRAKSSNKVKIELLEKSLILIYKHINSVISQCGVVSGNMARWIWIAHLAQSNSTITCDADSYYNAITDAIKEQTLPINFKHGLAGIGWGLIYMQKVGLINDIDSWILKSIDDQIACISIEKINIGSFFYGYGGILAYIITRIGYCITIGAKIPWNAKFLLKCKRISNSIKESHPDFPTLYYSYLFLTWYNAKDKLDWYDPRLSDWITVNQKMPVNMKYWKYDFDSGCLAHTIGLITYEPIYDF